MQPLVVGAGLFRTVGMLGNALLDALPRETMGRIAPSLEFCLLTAGDEVQAAGEPSFGLVFPTTAIVSLVAMLANGETAEAAAVGHEGVVGLGLVLGGGAMAQHAVVQVSGAAIRLRVELLRREFERSHALRQLLLSYCQAFMTQLAQNVLCGRLHSVEQRLCRWLLGTADRLRTGEIRMTQEAIAVALGVRREAVTIAAHHLLTERSISYARGHIVILDRAQLEAKTCECYHLLRDALNLHASTITALPVASDS